MNNLSDYKFSSYKSEGKKFKFIGSLVISCILIISILTIRYFTFSINYITPQIDLNIYFDFKLKILLLFITSLFLLINKVIIKKLILVNFFMICFINWSNYFVSLQGIEIFQNNYLSNNSYYEFNNLNILNIFYLLIFEIFYYIWSFLSYQNNLSDWSISKPKREDFKPLSKTIIFYLGVLIYYYIFSLMS